ncbi:two-component system, sporulation sensor kinase A [Paenibacillus sophorae]|uniref:histidine kinase n=1 Tax=Paenibacillus sophorae TaxID=1333845 RepID=A0A1H8MME2_9BACL|nr:PAS domain S-box protein [Paenibacillus sophorae]QWU17871.1 PAS domain S-box protein [Paenibacillus sophorae]SEO18479.1 two-component system, sporulation sensor kinase A [Paenibacillus sophorae]
MEKISKIQLPQYSLYSYLEYSPDAIYILDLNKKVVYVNPSFIKLYGWSKDDLNDMNFPHIPSELYNEWAGSFQYFDQKIEAVTLDTVRKKRDGELISISITISPLMEPDGSITAFLCLSRDVTENKVSEQKYYRLFNQANDSIFFFEYNDQGKVSNFIDVNDTACQKLGYSRQELLAKSPPDIADPGLADQFDSSFRSIVQGKTAFVEGIHVAKDGTRIPVEINSKIFKLNNKNMVISIVRDLTERKRTEELLRKSESFSLIGELSAGIAHEIRNPLTSIRGFAQLLFSETESIRGYRELVISEVDRINAIIGELLFLAKPQSSDLIDKDLITLLRQTITLLNAQAHLTENEIVMETNPGSLYIRCAENKLKQVFINILKNAIEASPKGAGIKVKVIRRKQCVLVRFLDQGKGIPAEIVSQIGSPFFTTKSGGTGLGIMISQKIIQDHHGTLHFAANKPKGTIVEIMLPLSVSQSID